MRANDFLTEADTLSYIKKGNLARRIELAFDHDRRLPDDVLYQLADRLTQDKKIAIVSSMIDQFMRNAETPSEYIPWILGQYINGHADLEDIGGEIVDLLYKFHQLKIRNIIRVERQRNINNYSDWNILERVLGKYQKEWHKIQKEAEFEKYKKTANQIVLMNNDRFLIQIPINFGSCYIFNKTGGVQANFCTGSSNGPLYFRQYSNDGPIIQILDKHNADSANGKWQIHAPSNQIRNAPQWEREYAFAQLFPGLLKEIGKRMLEHRQEIEEAGKSINANWNAERQVNMLRDKFRDIWNENPDPELANAYR